MNLFLQSIIKRFDAVTAVDGVSLEISDGECFFYWANGWGPFPGCNYSAI